MKHINRTPSTLSLLYAPCAKCNGKLQAWKVRNTIVPCKCGAVYRTMYDKNIGWHLRVEEVK